MSTIILGINAYHGDASAALFAMASWLQPLKTNDLIGSSTGRGFQGQRILTLCSRTAYADVSR
jgi:hypothetical protein